MEINKIELLLLKRKNPMKFENDGKASWFLLSVYNTSVAVTTPKNLRSRVD